jgi:hypothetical protein
MNRHAILLLLAGCSGPIPWSESVVELPRHTDEVVNAVASLPECGGVRHGGVIRWRARVTCNGSAAPVAGCAYPDRKPPLIEVVYQGSAWDGTPAMPEVSTLAHELCHVCGYVDGPDAEAQADACAMRARSASGR